MSAKYVLSPEWTDDQKAAVLFTPFRMKSLNPHSWERKMKFWSDALLECAEVHKDMILDFKTFTNHFERHGKYPKCLDDVTTEMVRVGKLQRLSDFQRKNSSWTVWGFNTFVRRPLVWGLTKLIPSPASPPDAVETIFIIPDQVKKKCREVLNHHYSQVKHETTENMMDLSAFRTQCQSILKSDTECDIVLKQLELDHKVLVANDQDGNMIVKISGQSESQVQPIQEIELNILRIQRVMKGLEQQIESLSGELDVYTAEARSQVKEGKKTLALHQLRKRRSVQRQIDRKSSCFDTLHDIIHRIEESSSNDMVLKAYESGVSAIRELTGVVTMGKVDQVLDDLQEVFGDQEEINQSLAGVTLAGSEVSADDLEMELDRLLAEGGERSHGDGASDTHDNVEDLVSGLAAYTLEDLPDVPTSSPGSKSQANSPQPRNVSSPS